MNTLDTALAESVELFIATDSGLFLYYRGFGEFEKNDSNPEFLDNFYQVVTGSITALRSYVNLENATSEPLRIICGGDELRVLKSSSLLGILRMKGFVNNNIDYTFMRAFKASDDDENFSKFCRNSVCKNLNIGGDDEILRIISGNLEIRNLVETYKITGFVKQSDELDAQINIFVKDTLSQIIKECSNDIHFGRNIKNKLDNFISSSILQIKQELFQSFLNKICDRLIIEYSTKSYTTSLSPDEDYLLKFAEGVKFQFNNMGSMDVHKSNEIKNTALLMIRSASADYSVLREIIREVEDSSKNIWYLFKIPLINEEKHEFIGIELKEKNRSLVFMPLNSGCSKAFNLFKQVEELR